MKQHLFKITKWGVLALLVLPILIFAPKVYAQGVQDLLVHFDLGGGDSWINIGGAVGINTTDFMYPGDANVKFEVLGDVVFSRGGETHLRIQSALNEVRLETHHKNLVIPDGNVGIGTVTPGQDLEITDYDDDAAIRYHLPGVSYFVTGIDVSDGGKFKLQYGPSFDEGPDSWPILTSTRYGNVGIGTTNPSHRFEVKGSVCLGNC